MRRRSTLILAENSDFDPASVKITDDSVFIPELKAAREEQLKYSLDELPEEIQQLLVNSQELHVRWASEQQYDTIAPYLSRTAPGLHVLYTPNGQITDDLLCPTLRKTFSPDLKCETPETTFIKSDVLESEFKTSPALQYHSLLPHVDHLVTYLQRTICPGTDLACIHSTSLLSLASTLDFSWSAITSTLTMSIFWSQPPGSLIDPTTSHKTTDAWSLSIPIESTSTSNRVEIGILSPEPPTSDPLDLTLSGFLIVPGTDTSPKPTRFTFPSRHHSASPNQQYSASITQPQGLHPTLLITFPSPQAILAPRGLTQCTLQAHLLLPSHTFIDPYALKPSDPSFVSTYHIAAIHSHVGHLDLEAPDYLPSTPWGSALLFTPLLPPSDSATHPPHASWEVTLPLHLRYLPPSPNSTHTEVSLPYPALYWACPADADAAAKFPVSPFDRVHLGYDASYGPLTSFHHLSPLPPPDDHASEEVWRDTRAMCVNTPDLSCDDYAGQRPRLVLEMRVPVLHTGSEYITPLTIEVVTLLTIIAGFLWVLRKMWPALRTELAGYVPETRETTTETSAREWREPIKGGGGVVRGPVGSGIGGGSGSGSGSVRRRG